MKDDHRPQDEIAARQEMQAALIEADYPKTDHIESYTFEWLHLYAESFRQAFNEISTRRPDFMRIWKEEPEKTLQIIREKMREIESR